MGKVVDTTYTVDSYELVSQTPPNFDKENYYLHTLQDKVCADWKYRPNRVDVEQEATHGKGDYYPLEVVIQTVRNDKGEKVSDDIQRLVFKDIHHKANLGTKFRFSFNFDLDEPEIDKNVWLVTNKDTISPTANVVVSRCNQTLGSIYIDENGIAQYHYEPAICTTDLKSTQLHYNNVIITPSGELAIIVQHNQYTQLYKLNQRFVLGYDKVYKVKAIDKFNSLKTLDPYSLGTIILYVELSETSPKDDFNTRIAFNTEDNSNVITPQPVIQNYTFKIVQPSPLPTQLFSQPIEFEAFLFNGEERIDVPIEVNAILPNVPNAETYYELVMLGNNKFSLRRLKLCNRSLLQITCSIADVFSPTGKNDFNQTFELSLRGLEGNV